jgi:Leucine-rich repeat (LRR) protein
MFLKIEKKARNKSENKMNLIKAILVLLSSVEILKAVVLDKTVLINQFGYNIDSTIIDLHNKGIESVSATTFSDYKNLEVLYLDGNNIGKIETGTFTGLTKMRIIWVENNSILSIPKSVLSGLNELEQFCIAKNPISEFNPTQLATLCATNKKCVLEITNQCRIPVTSKIYKNFHSLLLYEKLNIILNLNY